MALFDVVQWDNKPGEVICRFEEGAIALGSQLIVKEWQEAVISWNGQLLDSFGPGRHTLSTGNIPLLEKLLNLPFGGKSPFPAELYFVNRAEIPNMKWGTKQPMRIMDPVFNLPVPVRVFGSYSVRITDIKLFLIKAAGSWRAFTSEAILTAFRDETILPEIQDIVAAMMTKQNVTVLKLPAYYDEIGAACKAKLGDVFAGFGIELIRFVVESVSIPEDDGNVKRLKEALAGRAGINILGSDHGSGMTSGTTEKAATADGQAGAGESRCPECSAVNQPGAKFCSSCGANLRGTKCKMCGTPLQPGAKFCHECGERQQAEP